MGHKSKVDIDANIKDISDKAKNLLEQTKKGLEDANLPGRAKTLWDTVTSWFN
ncbi:Uncharacterised protein [Chlamydia trachomatis]|nr:Uncharacterised protein [Chlamydia trachomatis]